jgi:hypothetical protein
LAALVVLLLHNTPLFAETSLDVLEKDLDQVKQDHETASSQLIKNITSQLAAASASPDAALALYQQAGGLLPAPASAPPRNADETPDQEQARLAQDQQNKSRLALDLQAHCELMEYAVLFAANPTQTGLHNDWTSWLKAIGPVYPQLQSTSTLKSTKDNSPANATNSADSTDNGQNGGNRKRRWQQPQQNQDQLEPLGDWKTISMSQSIIGLYLGFHGWEGKEQGDWAISDIPKFYRTDILDPLRKTPTADTLAAWDVYIAMKNADQIEPSQWTQVDYPTLEFERAIDDYTLRPGMDKLQTLIGIIKSVPTHPQLDDMIARFQTLLNDYRTHHSPAGQTSSVATTDNSTSSTPGVSVQTTTAPPSNPAPPNQ